MKELSNLDYLKLSKIKRLFYRILFFFAGIPRWFKKIGLGIWNFIKKIGLKIKDVCVDFVMTFVHGDWKTKLSYFIWGFGNIARGQILRGILFLLFEIVFVGYMVLYGGHWISMLSSLGYQGRETVLETTTVVIGGIPMTDTHETVRYHDNSFRILLYGILTILLVVAAIYTWLQNIKQNRISEEIIKSGKKLKSGKDDLHSLIDDQFHKTLLALPVAGITIFTVLPILFMIVIAFTSYDFNHDGYINLFEWVGWDNFNKVISWNSGNANFSATFGEILGWTLIWAFFATFSNYFLGMLVAIMINKKGIKIKKFWRTVLVLTIAIPQFISLKYVASMFAKNGIVNGFLLRTGIISEAIKFWESKNLARVMVIVINIWIGIPYLMLIATGILMNIPQDLYESAKIDGANAWQQYTRITLPYMLFVTAPYLLTSFISNMNNFNVIYLLTAGGPDKTNASTAGGSAGNTDLLITWLFKLTTVDANYKQASVIGILIFLVVASISLIIYNVLPSTKNEEDFQ